MSDNTRTPLEEAALGVYMHVAQRIKEGYTEEAIKSELIEQGIKPATADRMLVKLNASRDNVTRRYGNRNRMIGWASIVVGLVVMIFGTSPLMVWGAGGALLVGGIVWLARATLQRQY